METILATNAGRPKTATLNGREHVVVPMRMLVSGVLSGSKGSLYYPPSEIHKTVDAWNGMPIVGRHPVLNGVHVSARRPDVLDKYGLGTVFHAKAVDGVLDGEAWLDVALTSAFDATLPTANRILPRINRGQAVELSTGLFTDNTPVRNGFDPKSRRKYDAVATRYRPDHLAVLPDERGACSVADGCGLAVNAAGYTFSDLLTYGDKSCR